jgi:hypothetical protein
MAAMSKKRAAPRGQQEAPQPYRLVRVPIDLYRRMKALAERNDRPTSREIRRALEAHLRAEGETGA